MSNSSEYIPPAVWTWEKASGGTFSNINCPITGATHEKELLVGLHPLQLCSLGTPNGQLDVLDRRLADNEFVAGADCTIINMAIWPWHTGLKKGWQYGEDGAAERGRRVNRTSGDPSSPLHERHDGSDFDTRTQDKLMGEQA